MNDTHLEFRRDVAEAKLAEIESEAVMWQQNAGYWWDDAKRAVRTQVQEVRASFNDLRGKSPEAWEESRESLKEAYDDLIRGYANCKGS